jgi:hypothetical protein
LLSITQIAPLLDRAYKSLHTVIREAEATVQRGFLMVWKHLNRIIDGSTHVDESGKVCSGYRGQEPPRNVVLAAARHGLAGYAGGDVTVIS